MGNKELGIADPVYDALRIRSGQSIAPDLGGGTTGAGGIENKIYVWHADGSTIDLFDPDEAGLALALTAAVSGDTVWLPSMAIALTSGVTLKAGVMLRGIDTSASISITANNATDYATLTGPASGTAYLSHLTILCTNSGAGDAIALNGGAGAVQARDCYLNGQSTSGAGYGAQAAAGVITLDDCWVLGSTSPLAGGGGSATYTPGAEISTGAIVVTDSAGSVISGLTVGNWYAIESFNGPWQAWPAGLPNEYSHTYSLNDGSGWSGGIGGSSEDGGSTWTLYYNTPAWIASSEASDDRRVRVYFHATTTTISIRAAEPSFFGDNTGTLSWRLKSATISGGGGSANIVTHAVRMATVSGDPAQGDRSVWDALDYPERHANDIDTAAGIHHTLGTGAAQAAAGDHTHASPPSNSYPVGWLAGWQYRKPITITNSDGTYTNKKVPIDVNLLDEIDAGKVNSDLSDLRITDNDGVSLLPFFGEFPGTPLSDPANWHRYAGNPIISPGTAGAWDDNWIVPGSVIYSGGTYYLYYWGAHENQIGGVGLATSSDGLTFSKSVSNPIVDLGAGGTWDDTTLGSPTVIKEGSNWYMWYGGSADTNFNTKIGYATSSDGVTWTKYGSNPVISFGGGGAWDSFFVIPTQVFKIGSVYYMLYWGGTTRANDTSWSLGLATSTDRVTWTKHASNPVFTGASGQWDHGVLCGNIIQIGSTYYLFYQGDTSDTIFSALGVATSTNLINWTRAATNPFPRGGVGTWDVNWSESPVIIPVGETYYLYYMGSNNTPIGGPYPKPAGVLIFDPTRLWPVVPTVPAGSSRLYLYYGNASADDVSTGSAGSPDANITVTIGAEFTPDLAAWDDETQPDAHARDIDDATYTYHLNPAFNGDVGTFGDESNIPQITVDAHGLITAAENVAIASGHEHVYQEDLSAVCNGSTTLFYTTNTYESETTQVWINGILQRPVTQYAEDTSSYDTLTLNSAPIAGDEFIVAYIMEMA